MTAMGGKPPFGRECDGRRHDPTSRLKAEAADQRGAYRPRLLGAMPARRRQTGRRYRCRARRIGRTPEKRGFAGALACQRDGRSEALDSSAKAASILVRSALALRCSAIGRAFWRYSRALSLCLPIL